jgi:catalase (peroxidase I)
LIEAGHADAVGTIKATYKRDAPKFLYSHAKNLLSNTKFDPAAPAVSSREVSKVLEENGWSVLPSLEALHSMKKEQIRVAAEMKMWAILKDDIIAMMDKEEWDDGSYGPLLLRLAWHSSGTYCKTSNSGGSCGATMRFPLESNDPENVGLDHARELMAGLHAKYNGKISHSDIWILASYCFLEKSGGPVIDFTSGRIDATEDKAVPPGRLPEAEHGLVEQGVEDEVDAQGRVKGWENLAEHIRQVFGRMGLEDKEIVALLCGGHVYGRCHPKDSGYAGKWVEVATEFSNEYAADMIEDEWFLITHETEEVDGKPVPEEVCPHPAVGFKKISQPTAFGTFHPIPPPPPDCIFLCHLFTLTGSYFMILTITNVC